MVDDKLRFSRHIAAAAACASRKLGLDLHNFFIMREDATGRGNTKGHHLKIFKQRRNTVQRRKFFSHRVG